MSAAAPMSYRRFLRATVEDDRRVWGHLSDEERRFLRMTALHSAAGGELYTVYGCHSGEAFKAATVARVEGPRTLECRRARWRYVVRWSTEKDGPFFHHFRTRVEADRHATTIVEAKVAEVWAPLGNLFIDTGTRMGTGKARKIRHWRHRNHTPRSAA